MNAVHLVDRMSGTCQWNLQTEELNMFGLKLYLKGTEFFAREESSVGWFF